MPKKHTMPYGLNTPPIKAALKWKLGGLLQKKRSAVPDDDIILTQMIPSPLRHLQTLR